MGAEKKYELVTEKVFKWHTRSCGYKPPGLVCQGFCYKVSQPAGLKEQKCIFSQVMEAVSWEQRSPQSLAPSETQEMLMLPLPDFQW